VRRLPSGIHVVVVWGFFMRRHGVVEDCDGHWQLEPRGFGGKVLYSFGISFVMVE
jgi:hypothetical protein